jgi:SynChlorMet cassette radical SAM/SPASM protein ScmF
MLYFYLTEGCNLRCRHCWIEPPHQSEKRQYPALDPELFRHIVSQAKPLGLSGVKLTGGEPLMHPRFGEVLEIIRQEAVELTVETNGVLCSTEMVQDLRRSNLRHISVSLDGADADTHEWVRGVKGCFDAAVSGIQNLVAAGIRPQIIMSLMRRNVGQIERFVLLAESLGASSVKFNIVQPTARGIKMYRAGETLSIENLVKLGDWVENHLSSSVGIRLYYSHPMAFRSLGRMYGRQGDGCGNCNITHILGVLADGSYALCGIGMTVQEMIFGHAERDTLADVWKRTPILNEVRKGLPGRLGGICGDCLMKGVCRGYCLAQNFNNTRNLWAPFWYCEEARRLGIFPESRQKEQVIQHGRGDSRAQSSVAPRPVCGSEEKNNGESAFQV